MKKFPAAQAGVALVEFALALPLLVIVLIGITEMGRLAYYNILVGSAAHAGAMYASLNTYTANDTVHIKAAAESDGQNIPQLTVSPAPPTCNCYNSSSGSSTTLSCALNGSTCASGTHRVIYVQVSATGKIDTLFNYKALGIPDPWTITRTATVRVSNTAQ